MECRMSTTLSVSLPPSRPFATVVVKGSCESTAAVLHLRESVSFISADRQSAGSIYGSFAALNGVLDRHTDRILGILEPTVSLLEHP